MFSCPSQRGQWGADCPPKTSCRGEKELRKGNKHGLGLSSLESRAGSKGSVVVQVLSHVRLFATPWTAACQTSQSFTISQRWLKLMSIEPVMPSNHLNHPHPLLMPSIFPSIRVFSNELALPIRWPKYYSFSFSISPSNEHSALISFRMDWLDLLAVQGTLKNLL